MRKSHMELIDPNKPTALERSILDTYYKRFMERGFPPPTDFIVVGRNNTGSGRYTRLSHPNETALPEGRLDIGTYGQINMDNIRYGASFWLYVKGHKIFELEIAVNGTEYWDGTERDWEMCNPDTGEF
jgi:hypothetical protein